MTRDNKFVISAEQLEEQGYQRRTGHGLQSYFTHCSNCGGKSTHHRPLVKKGNSNDFKYICENCNCHVTYFLDKAEKEIYTDLNLNYDYKRLAKESTQ